MAHSTESGRSWRTSSRKKGLFCSEGIGERERSSFGMCKRQNRFRTDLVPFGVLALCRWGKEKQFSFTTLLLHGWRWWSASHLGMAERKPIQPCKFNSMKIVHKARIEQGKRLCVCVCELNLQLKSSIAFVCLFERFAKPSRGIQHQPGGRYAMFGAATAQPINNAPS